MDNMAGKDGGRHKPQAQKQKTMNKERMKSVTDTAEKKAVDRKAMLEEIFGLMDKDKDGHVCLCAANACPQLCASLNVAPRRSAEFKTALSGGLEGEWENPDVQKVATEHYNAMDKMGNANGVLEARECPTRAPHTVAAFTSTSRACCAVG